MLLKPANLKVVVPKLDLRQLGAAAPVSAQASNDNNTE